MFWVELIFEWHEDAMILCVFIFIFLFIINVRKGYLDESNFRNCYLVTTMFKVPSEQIWNTLTTAFWKAPYTWRSFWTWFKIRANSFTKTWVNIMKQTLIKVSWKLPLATKYDPAFQRTLHQYRLFFTYFYTSFSLKQI